MEAIEDDNPIAWERESVAESPWARQTALMACGVISAALLVAVVWAIAKRNRDVEVAPTELAGSVAVAREEFDEGTRAVIEAVSSFVAATTMEEKLEWVWRTEGIERRMGDYYERVPVKTQQIYDFPLIALTQRPRGNFYRVQALTVDNERLNFAVPVAAEGPRIAWESHVGYSEVDWETFIDRRTTQSVEMRVYVEPATHYIAPYEDKDEFLAIQISRPESPRKVFGFVGKSATEGVAAMRSVLLSGSAQPVVVRARFPDATKPVVLIDAFLGEGWFTPPTTNSALPEFSGRESLLDG